MKRWTHRPEMSNWGDFGPDDQKGRLNLITPERRRAAAREVREGIAFPLSMPLDFPRGSGITDARLPPKLFATQLNGQATYNLRFSPPHRDVACDDAAVLYLQRSTQWDSLAHMGALFDADGSGEERKVYYNGYRGGLDIRNPDEADGPRALALGVENMAETGVQGRGVLVDLRAECGTERVAFGYDRLMDVMRRQAVVVEEGDIVCFHTGMADLIVEAGDDEAKVREAFQSCAVLDSSDTRLLHWISEAGIAALAADNFGIEDAHPHGPDDVLMPLHHHCIFKLGMPLGELWRLGELAGWLRRNRRSRFLLTAPPLMLPGAVGSPVTPVATV